MITRSSSPLVHEESREVDMKDSRLQKNEQIHKRWARARGIEIY